MISIDSHGHGCGKANHYGDSWDEEKEDDVGDEDRR